MGGKWKRVEDKVSMYVSHRIKQSGFEPRGCCVHGQDTVLRAVQGCSHDARLADFIFCEKCI